MNTCPHCHKEIKPKPRKKAITKTWRMADPEYVTAQDINNLILINYPSLKEKLNRSINRGKAAQAISDCMVKHGYKLAELLEICEWVYKHKFWKHQFQAVPKLTRRDNGSTGITLVWIDRFKLEMQNGSRKSVEALSEAFRFDGGTK